MLNSSPPFLVHEKYANLDVKFNNHRLHIEDHGGYESRHASMINLIRDAWHAHIRNDLPLRPYKFFTLFTDDHFNPSLHFSFAAVDRQTAFRSMPNFIFDAWPECGIPEYQALLDEMSERGSEPFEFERAFWVGVVFDNQRYSYCHRHIGLKLHTRRPDIIDFRSIEWAPRGPNRMSDTRGYVSLVEHCRHRVLLDFGGIGFSARLPLLLASGRPVVLVGRPHEAWFYWDGSLVPWEHFIPCGDFSCFGVTESDLERSLSWAEENREEASAIGVRGREYARKYLTRSAAVSRIGSMMDSFCGQMWPVPESPFCH